MTRKWIPEMFWAKVDIKGPDECWIWQGGQSTSHDGANIYGSSIDGRTGRRRRAHVLAYELTYPHRKPITRPYVGMHTCDTTLCCNPRHVKRGTQKQNVQDSIRKGRFYKGRKYRFDWKRARGR